MAALVVLVFLVGAAAAHETDTSTAALVIGGTDGTTNPGGSPNLKSVEIFGCGDGESHFVSEYPERVYLGGGGLGLDGESVVFCGGQMCNNTNCRLENLCYSWSPHTDQWKLFDDLNQARWSFDIFEGPNLEFSGNPTTHIALGYHIETEVYNKASGVWDPYKNLPNTNWYALGCMAQLGNKVYHIRDSIEVLDLDTWSFSNLGAVPSNLRYPLRCAAVEMHGKAGIFTRWGYFYCLVDEEWEKYKPPPYNPIDTEPNAMWSFHGRPTIFGNPRCNDNGECRRTEVLQFIEHDDEWISLGDLAQPRTYHEVIEVPGSFCEILGYPAPNPEEPETTTPAEGEETSTMDGPDVTTGGSGSETSTEEEGSGNNGSSGLGQSFAAFIVLAIFAVFKC